MTKRVPNSSVEGLTRLDELNEVVCLLNSDKDVLKRHLTMNQDRDFWIRTAVRTFFADTEARMFQFRRICLLLADLEVITLDPLEIVCLRDKRFKIERGLIIEENARTRTPDNFLFAVAMFSKAIGITNPVDTSSDLGWEHFRFAISVRDRLVHPKILSDLSVSAEEMNRIAEAIDWVEKVCEHLCSEAATRIVPLVERLSE